ncbi:MAG TPA: hypothetical protein VNH44_10695, partial [Micropepsaceae bacterium]|nr:hypothetical protein [Micropepsaceae bacterium]
MNAAALKFMAQPLRVSILAANPQHLASLSQLVRDLGHVVVSVSQRPSVVLTDGAHTLATRVP